MRETSFESFSFQSFRSDDYILEGTNCSEGRGTTLPFELVGATWADGSLADAMRSQSRWDDGKINDIGGTDKGSVVGGSSNKGGGGGGSGDGGDVSGSDGGKHANGNKAANDDDGSGFVFGGTRESIALRSPRRGGRGGGGGGRGASKSKSNSNSTSKSVSALASSASPRLPRGGAPRSGPAARYREAYFTPTSGWLQGGALHKEFKLFETL